MSVIYEDEYGKDWPFSPEELAGKGIMRIVPMRPR